MEKLLIYVEDSEADRWLFQEAIRSGGIEVSLKVFETAFEFLKFLKKAKNRPDLLVVDLELPRMNGPQLIKKLRNDPNYSDLTMILFSSRSSRDSGAEAKTCGANAFLTKPSDLAKYMKTVQDALRQWL